MRADRFKVGRQVCRSNREVVESHEARIKCRHLSVIFGPGRVVAKQKQTAND